MVFVTFCGAFEMSLSTSKAARNKDTGQSAMPLRLAEGPAKSDVPGDVQSLPDVPHRARRGVRHGRDKHVRSGAGRELRAEDGLHGEREERGDGGELGEHGCRSGCS